MNAGKNLFFLHLLHVFLPRVGLAEELLPAFTYYPQRGAQVCSDFIDIIQQQGYPQFKLTCDCGGVLITDPGSGVTIPIQGNFHVKCRSDCFFASPDNKVWWYLYWQADFGLGGLERIRQNSHYVKGRHYYKGPRGIRQFWEKFYYLHGQENCKMILRGTTSIGRTCQKCAALPGRSKDNGTCYEIDCSNVNVGTITKPHYAIEAINNTCKSGRVSDFATNPLAASSGFLQEDVRQIYPEGGVGCIAPLARLFRSREDMECTCRSADESEHTDESPAYMISCLYPCVYGPQNGEIEFLTYFEGLYVPTLSNILSGTGRMKWKQRRYEYILGRDDTEIFQNIPDASIHLKPDKCWASQNGIPCESCGYTSWLSSTVLLNCTNLPNGTFLEWQAPSGIPRGSQPQGSSGGAWKTTPFAASLWGKDNVCLRPAAPEDVALAAAQPPTSMAPSEAPSATPSASPTLSHMPSGAPSAAPSSSPTLSHMPSGTPSASPSSSPTLSHMPSGAPSVAPTSSPTEAPSVAPSSSPTASPL